MMTMKIEDQSLVQEKAGKNTCNNDDKVRSNSHNNNNNNSDNNDNNLIPSEEVHPFDILCGKTKFCLTHAGSKRFKIVIESYRERYAAALTKYDKMTVTREIYNTLVASNSRKDGQRPARFLRYNATADAWEELSSMAARDKVGHALRFANRESSHRRRGRPSGSSSSSSCNGGSSSSSNHSHRSASPTPSVASAPPSSTSASSAAAAMMMVSTGTPSSTPYAPVIAPPTTKSITSLSFPELCQYQYYQGQEEPTTTTTNTSIEEYRSSSPKTFSSKQEDDMHDKFLADTMRLVGETVALLDRVQSEETLSKNITSGSSSSSSSSTNMNSTNKKVVEARATATGGPGAFASTENGMSYFSQQLKQQQQQHFQQSSMLWDDLGFLDEDVTDISPSIFFGGAS